MGYLICSKCKSYYKLQSGESAKNFVGNCVCGGKYRYVENLDFVDPNWKQVYIQKKGTRKEILRNKMQSMFSVPKDLKNRLIQYFQNKFGRQIYNAQNRNKTKKSPYGMDMAFINSVINELNFYNIRWILIIPVAIAIILILTVTHGIFNLLIFILLAAVGYLFDNQIIGTKNAVVTGAISFFLGSLFIGSFLYIIPFTLLGAINGAVCGWIGGYIKTRI
ncbi:MAG: MFS transporter [Methanobacterium sp.]|uniref:MFS transporter n=1 Tax=Methanobacterium sp. TaxID=2164 RepID=UPI003C76C893